MKDRDLVPMRFRTPFSLMRRLSDDMERMFEEMDVTRPFTFTRPGGRVFDWLPPIEVFEKDNLLTVRAELPGLTKDDVKIEITERVLTLKGERKQEKHEKGEGFITTERSYGSFLRQVALPEGVNADIAKATFKHGILEIQMPVTVKKPAATRTLPIEETEKTLVGV